MLKHLPDGQEEIWQERIYLRTEEVFPTVLRRSEVVDIQIHEISPLEAAINEVDQRTKELATLNSRYQGLARTSAVSSTNQLAMALNAAVDTPDGNGIPAYRHVFFAPDYVARFPERGHLLEKLREVIDDHVCHSLLVSVCFFLTVTELH